MGSGDIGGTMAITSMLDGWIAEARQRAERAQCQFTSFCDRERLAITHTPPVPSGVTAEWHQEVGRESTWVVEYGQACDLITIGRPVDGGGISADTLETALFETGRPLLIPGAGSMNTPAETIAIAWKPTAQAARAVGAALPFLANSKSITILTVGENERVGEESSAKLVAALAWHGLKVSARHLQPGDGSAADTLLAAARRMGVGLLVMGGYGHSRFREFMFGGFTEQALRSADLPVLMMH